MERQNAILFGNKTLENLTALDCVVVEVVNVEIEVPGVKVEDVEAAVLEVGDVGVVAEAVKVVIAEVVSVSVVKTSVSRLSDEVSASVVSKCQHFY